MAFIKWNVNPELFRAGPLQLHWYGIFLAAAFLCGYLIVRWEFETEDQHQRSLHVMLLYVIAGSIIGGRAEYILFHRPPFDFSHPLEVLEIWKGGLGSHGGVAGILIALYLYKCRRPGEPYLWLVDRITVPIALGAALVRLGNLFNSENVGYPTAVPWAFVFPRVDSTPRHPALLYEAAGYAVIFVIILMIYRRLNTRTPPGLIVGIFLAGVFSCRFFADFLRQHPTAYDQNFFLSLGQWLSLPFVLAGIFLIARAFRPGATASAAASPSPPRAA